MWDRISSNVRDFEPFVALLFVRDNSVASEDLFIRRVQFFIKQRLMEVASSKRSPNGYSVAFSTIRVKQNGLE